MKRIRIVGLGLVAMFAIGAVASASASAAAPEYRVCVKAAKKTGNYNDKSCSVSSEPGKDKYELAPWTAAKDDRFTGKLSTLRMAVWLEGGGTFPGECRHGSLTGEVTGSKSSSLTLHLEGCSVDYTPCSSPSEEMRGNISFPLDGELVAISGGSGVGMRLRGADPGADWGEAFYCNYEIQVLGELTGEVGKGEGSSNKNVSYNFEISDSGSPTIESPEPLIFEHQGDRPMAIEAAMRIHMKELLDIA